MADSYAEIRKPAVAGAFYPGTAGELRQMIERHLAGVSDLPDIDGQIMALIVPHAGLVYSGQIAAHAYKLLENSPVCKVILCGPTHRYRFDGLSVYGPGVEWETPLGELTCDDDLCSRLLKFSDRINIVPEAHLQEHCLEVQLPYLQSVLDDFKIVPVIMGPQDPSNIKLLADALASLDLDSTAVMVASTDWQHYRPASEGWKYDSTGIQCLEDMDPDRLEKYLHTGKVEMCGGGAAVAVLKAAMDRGADRVKILKYGDSGDVSGDKTAVVGYVAAVVYKASKTENDGNKEKKEKATDMKEELEKFELSDSDKTRLLQIARETIQKYLADGKIPEFEVPDNLKIPGAAFVTLEEHDNLRGCIGHVVAVEPLYKTVAVCAVQAAVSDPRFPSVRPEELKDIHIEISVLTPQQKVESLDEIEVGRDGLVIAQGDRRGLLLPQVAVEYGWNRTEFLQHTCRKAGLPVNAYQFPGTEIYKFQALIFGE
ncbi:MAG: AmmeMemoRadiSam system protein B [candidate division Zixibacteria bacterium]|nr:AmmeMemoRadiSam system protein B [candidate division Zixibacteria bacterium]